jgi:hypothetical protein
MSHETGDDSLTVTKHSTCDDMDSQNEEELSICGQDARMVCFSNLLPCASHGDNSLFLNLFAVCRLLHIGLELRLSASEV